jgi:hypothetical protein
MRADTRSSRPTAKGFSTSRAEMITVIPVTLRSHPVLFKFQLQPSLKVVMRSEPFP